MPIDEEEFKKIMLEAERKLEEQKIMREIGLKDSISEKSVKKYREAKKRYLEEKEKEEKATKPFEISFPLALYQFKKELAKIKKEEEDEKSGEAEHRRRMEKEEDRFNRMYGLDIKREDEDDNKYEYDNRYDRETEKLKEEHKREIDTINEGWYIGIGMLVLWFLLQTC